MRIAYIGSYPPRECGIATFTRDLVRAIENAGPGVKSMVIALNQGEEVYDYETRVKLQVDASKRSTYSELADFLNKSSADIVNIQHEFGLYGGPSGQYLLSLTENLKKPAITTLHTVLPEPGEIQGDIVRRLSEHSGCVVVMANKAVTLLVEKYGVPGDRIRVIHHGVPETKFVSERVLGDFMHGYADRTILSAFGLISHGKGIEYAIMAMPKIVKRHPEAVYFVIGETHPEVRKIHGESYRMKLMHLAADLKMGEHVKFHNRYLDLKELLNYLQATDVYITPYLDPDQITSGTLAYALSCGKAVVSTPYLYAQEMLADGRGILAEFKDPDSIASAVNRILDNPQLKSGFEKNAYEFTRQMTWSNVGRSYLNLFRGVAK